MKILILGDMVGQMGLNYFKEILPELKRTYNPNLIIVNAENINQGKGLTQKQYKELMALNVSCLTMGNHTFRTPEINTFIEGSKIARPMNLEGVKGDGFVDINYNGKIITVVNLLGSINMKMDVPILNPYLTIESFIKNHKFDELIVDFHAETTSEKVAMGYFLDGIALAVLGTHTHVQTADAKVLPKGTMYITDLGMTGPADGVIGVKKEIIIDRLAYNGQLPFKLEDSGKVQLNGAILETGIKNKITPIHFEKN